MLPTLFDYTQGAHAATDAYLANVGAVDFTNLGRGEITLGYILNRFLLGHIDNLYGEIS